MGKTAKDSEVPGIILPAQYFTSPALSATPEKRLIFAVLMDAVAQLQSGDVDRVLDAECWIRGEFDDVPITFADACDALGLNADGLADGLISRRGQLPFVPRAQRRVAHFGRLRARGSAPTAASMSPECRLRDRCALESVARGGRR